MNIRKHLFIYPLLESRKVLGSIVVKFSSVCEIISPHKNTFKVQSQVAPNTGVYLLYFTGVQCKGPYLNLFANQYLFQKSFYP